MVAAPSASAVEEGEQRPTSSQPGPVGSRSEDATPPLSALQGSLTPKAAAAIVREHLDPRDVRVFLRSSPARLIAMGIVLVVLCVAAGAVAAATVRDRQQTLNTVLDETEPYAASSQRLYSSLSIADAAASTAFISGGIEPKAVRDAYSQAIGEAAAELAVGAADPEDADARKLAATIASKLPVYAGLVETARTNNRNGHPVGAAYLGEASTLMQTTMLPAAEDLSARQSAAVVDAQRAYTTPPWFSFALLVLALVALFGVQVLLARHWRRILNPGLIVASAIMVALFVWMAVGGSLSAAAADRALGHGTLPLAKLTEGRILAQQARSDETLKLVRRDTSGEYDAAFDDDMARLGAVLTDYGSDIEGSDRVADALRAHTGWLAAHKRMNDTLATGDFTGASIVAIGPGDADSTAQFEALDTAVQQGIVDTRDTLRSNVSRASTVVDKLTPGALTLAFAAAFFVLVGLWPRLREYR
ncbi:hypothetical protein JGU71_11970 [Antrihabitans sp. YC3-6]|uniref:Secreted protein n=1 Tax=Antrihabitans stalagmiti TaxID=2799499 RepID=A0A934NQR3_9NOCA|nr:hypothetical protein [Antrihabitans stalagmiti]MBJ8339604.1 hypothetical protein [Antrihabitans stalagmiti]